MPPDPWDEFLAGFSRSVEAAAARLASVGEAEAARPIAPGKWSRKEILGHLIDSAANNHQRFVRARFQGDLVFSGYEQDAWVAAQGYSGAPWTDLVQLWRLYNLHLARVMAAIPAEARTRTRARHNLHEIAWRTVPHGEPTTLEYFLRDYVGHLQHHLAQAGVDQEPSG